MKPCNKKLHFSTQDVCIDGSKPLEHSEFEITVKCGSAKPMPNYIWLVSMTSSHRCPSAMMGLCPISDDCYGKVFEDNAMMGANTIRCREKDESAIDYLVNHPTGALFFASELAEMSNRCRNPRNRLKFLRWNMTGDLKSLQYLIFVEQVADYLFNELGVISVIYTHRSDLKNAFEKIRHNYESLRILGSGFNWDANFTCFPSSDDGKECSSNCSQCFEEYGIGFCYDTSIKNCEIVEEFRENPNKA